MQRFFTGLLCFLVPYVLYGCTTFNSAFSPSGQESAKRAEPTSAVSRPVRQTTNKTPAREFSQQTQTKAPDLLPGTTQTCSLASVACVPATAGISHATPSMEKHAPIVQIPQKFYNFGTLTENKDYVHKFLIKNAGTSTLKIEKIIPG